jgi:hypothetical protein
LCSGVDIVFERSVDDSDPVGTEEAELASVPVEEGVSGQAVVLLGSVKKFSSGQIPRAFQDGKFRGSEQATGFALKQ